MEKFVELIDKFFGFTNKKKANFLVLLGKISNNLKQFSQAYIYYQKANNLYERLEGINNMFSINCLLKMAQIKHDLKEYILAFELYEKVLQMYIARLGNNHFYVYVVYLNLIFLSHLLKYEDKKEFYYAELIHHCCNQVNKINHFINVIFSLFILFFKKNKYFCGEFFFFKFYFSIKRKQFR